MAGSAAAIELETASGVAVQLLGSFAIRVGAEVLRLVPMAQRLVALLAIKRDRVSREQIAGTLWADSSDREAAANLRTTLWRIRRSSRSLIVGDQHTLGLAPSVVVDLWQMNEAVRRLRNEELPEDSLLAAMLQAELLPGWYDEWVVLEREFVRQIRLHGLEILARRQTLEGRYADAIATALAAVRCDDLRESAHRVVIEVHLAEGNYSEAVRHFTTFSSHLRAALDLEPSSQLVDLIESATGRLPSVRHAGGSGDVPVTRP